MEEVLNEPSFLINTDNSIKDFSQALMQCTWMNSDFKLRNLKRTKNAQKEIKKAR